MAAAVPFAGATMTGFGAAAATSGASLFAASAIAAPIASAGASMMMSPAILSPGGAGFFSTLGSSISNFLNRPLLSTGTDLFGDITVKQLGYGISQGMGIIQSIRQGQIMKSQYELQAAQTLADMDIKRANAAMSAAERLRKLQQIQSSIVTKSYARGVSGLDGSALLAQIISDQEYGQDYKIDLFNLNNIMTTGNVNAAAYKTAGKEAVTSSVLDSAIKLGEAAYAYDKLYG
jgi:hypothetical protein